MGEHFERPPDVLVREVGDELVLLNTGSADYHGLDEVGRRCYELLIDGNDVDGTVEVIANEYAVSPETVRADLLELLTELERSGLLART